MKILWICGLPHEVQEQALGGENHGAYAAWSWIMGHLPPPPDVELHIACRTSRHTAYRQIEYRGATFHLVPVKSRARVFALFHFDWRYFREVFQRVQPDVIHGWGTEDCYANTALRQELECLRQASYFAVLLEKSTEPEAPVPELHELLKKALDSLADQPTNPETVFAFELKLLCALGYTPDLGSLKEIIRKRVETAINSSFKESVKELLLLETAARLDLNRFLQRAIGTALERVLPQRAGALSM